MTINILFNSSQPPTFRSPGTIARAMNLHDPDFFNSDAQDIYGSLPPGGPPNPINCLPLNTFTTTLRNPNPTVPHDSV